MDENNVFNSFSFKKWADYVRKEKIENEILRQRMEQVTRLRTKLVRERHLRDQADLLTDEDIDRVIGYLGAGHTLNSGGASEAGTSGGSGAQPGGGGYSGALKMPAFTTMRLSEKVPAAEYAPKDDDYIFNEIKEFYARNHSLQQLHNAIPIRFKHNQRLGGGDATSNAGMERAFARGALNPRSRFFKFAHNRRFSGGE